MSIIKSVAARNSAFGALLALAAIAAPATVQAAGDAANGEKVFRKCATCHMVGENAKNKVGPVLTGVIGRAAGTAEDFRYGASLAAAGEAGLVWSEDEIFTYLENPRGFLSDKLGDKRARSKMAFRLRGEDDRRDVIAYLATFSEAVEEAAVETSDDVEVASAEGASTAVAEATESGIAAVEAAAETAVAAVKAAAAE